jgi:hypothetical protein
MSSRRIPATRFAPAIALIIVSPSIMGMDGKHLIHAAALFPLENPGIVSIPLGFIGAFAGAMMSRVDDNAEARFTELEVRAREHRPRRREGRRPLSPAGHYLQAIRSING